MFSLEPEHDYYSDWQEDWCSDRADEFREAASWVLGERKFAEILMRALAGAIEDGDIEDFENTYGLSKDNVACFLMQSYPCKRREEEVKERFYKRFEKIRNHS